MKTYIFKNAMLGFVLLLGVLFPVRTIQAQTLPSTTQTAIDSLEEATRLEVRREVAKSTRQTRRTALHRRAAELKIPLTKNGGSLRSIEPNGHPIYDMPDNTVSQRTTSANQVKTGGNLGLNLTGTGITIGIWEAGGVPRVTHQEFGGRAVVIDGSTATTNHACHVAGTLIGAGVGTNTAAQGFSHAGRIDCYDAANDEDEMDDAASDASPIRLSNHSYGPGAGWTDPPGMPWQWDGATWQFGAYNDAAETWDEIAFDNPLFTIFKSAGNHRGDGPANPPAGQPIDGPYDCITTYSTAKNIVTVGAVDDINGGYAGPASVQQVAASFSSWGPTDDGRIKPDIVANGTGLFSAFSNTDTTYGTMGGTSMATPSAAGGAGLLLQHWGNILGGTPRSATLKGLIINEADEAGAANGPDYQMGWGLMNVADAAQMITFEGYDGCRHYLEGSLDDEEEFTYQFQSSGTQPIKVTLTWTDVPSDDTNNGTQNPAGVRYLVNDLNLRITRPDGTTAFPWVLDPANPGNAATNGNNDRDNVEQVLLLNPAAGTYTISVRAPEDVDDNPQQFTLWMSGNDSENFDRLVSAQVISNTQTITARHHIQMGPDVTITPTANVRSLAGNSITLKPNFHAQAGSQYLARIMPGGGCGIFSGQLKADNYPGSTMAGEQMERTEPIATINAATTQLSLSAQPNPFDTYFSVQIELPTDESTTLTLRDMTGQLLFTWLDHQATRVGTYNFDYQANNLPSGMYFVELKTATHQQTTKVVKVR